MTRKTAISSCGQIGISRCVYRARLTATLFVGLAFGACSGTYKQQLNFDPNEPIRVAVVPFGFADEKGELVDKDAGLLVDNVPLVSSKAEESPPDLVRGAVSAALERTRLDVIAPGAVEGSLLHNGMGIGLKPDLKKIYSISPAQICDLLGCDAVVYGKVTKWDRSYYGLQTINTVGIELRMVNAHSGKEMYVAKAEDTDSRGISKGPTGWTSLAIEPVKGLSNEIITDLANSMVEKMMKPLFTSSRPEFMNSSPPAIFASSHDSRSGKLGRDDHLTVLIFGTPKGQATFSIGNIVQNVPMSEKQGGHYIGEYYPLKNDKFDSQFVRVSLTDQFGRTTEQKVGMGPVALH